MLNLVLKVAVTGGIASGKSSVCRFLEEFGAYVIYADNIVHKLLSPSTHLGKKIIDLLGEDVVIGHQFNRQAIAEKVFKNGDLLKKFEDLIHPQTKIVIENEYQAFLSKIQEDSKIPQLKTRKALFVVEIPLLFEKGFEKDYDKTILVVADQKSCQKRYENSRGVNNDYLLRTQHLIPQEKKVLLSDEIIKNEGTLEDLKLTVKKLYEQLTVYN